MSASEPLLVSDDEIVELDERDGGQESYFDAYDDVKVHELMLDDIPRGRAYAEAIKKIPNIADKVVLDVGSGTGFLSLLALKAGAKRVYAVEAAVGISALSKRIAEDNGYGLSSGRLVVLNQKLEEVQLPEKVDVIVSEWMGFYLLNESMLDSVIYARDRWLKPGGLLLPDSATLYFCPVSLDAFWHKKYHQFIDYFGLNMSCIAEHNLAQLSAASYIIEDLTADQVLGPAAPIFTLDLATVALSELSGWMATIEFSVDRAGSFHGIAAYFDVGFLDNAVTLSTSPAAPPTHWKQTTLLLPTPDGFQVQEGVEIEVVISLLRLADNPRGYSITMAFPE